MRALGCAALVALACVGCSAAQTKTVAGGVVKIGVDWCAEEAQQPNDPAWIALVCSLVSDVSTLAVTPAGGTAHVVIPRAEWESMKAARASADAGSSP